VLVNKRAVITMPRTGRPHPVLLCDVSNGGACVQTDADLAVGDEVLLRAELAADIKVAVTAVITGARTRRQMLYGQYGLRFVRVEPAARLALDAFVGSAAKKTG
jgi:Tfp pilus assembly protein PilZ